MLKFSSPVNIYDRLSSEIKSKYFEAAEESLDIGMKEGCGREKVISQRPQLAFSGSHISHPLEIVFLLYPV